MDPIVELIFFISNPKEPSMYCRIEHRRSFVACCNIVTLLLGNNVVQNYFLGCDLMNATKCTGA